MDTPLFSVIHFAATVELKLYVYCETQPLQTGAQKYRHILMTTTFNSLFSEAGFVRKVPKKYEENHIFSLVSVLALPASMARMSKVTRWNIF